MDSTSLPGRSLAAPGRRAWRRSGVLALALAASACAHGGLSPDRAADPKQLLADLLERQRLVQRVRGTARVRVEAPGVKGTLLELVVAEKPDRVRLETLDFFGNPVAVLVADGARFGFYDARSRTFYRGDATAENVSRFLPIAIPPDELVTILCGSAPILPGTAIEARPRDGRVELVVARGEVAQQLVVGEALVVESSRVRRADPDPSRQATFYDLDFSSFRTQGKARFPNALRLEAASAKARVGLDWREDLEVNGEAERALFAIAPPRGAKVVDLPPGAAMPDVELPFAPDVSGGNGP